MPDTAVIENEDALAADFDEAGEEEERPQTFAELGVPGPLVRVLAADGNDNLLFRMHTLLHSFL